MSSSATSATSASGWFASGPIRHHDKSDPVYPAVRQQPPHPRFNNPASMSLNPYPDWCDFTQEEWDTIPMAVTKFWNPNCGRPEWEPYSCYDFLLLISDTAYRDLDREALTAMCGQYGAIWKDMASAPAGSTASFQHTHLTHTRYFLIRMPFGLKSNRDAVLRLREQCIRLEYNPSKILPRVNFQSLQLRFDVEATLAMTEAGRQAVGVRNKIALPTLRERAQTAPIIGANGGALLEVNRPIDDTAAAEMAQALVDHVRSWIWSAWMHDLVMIQLDICLRDSFDELHVSSHCVMIFDNVFESFVFWCRSIRHCARCVCLAAATR
jgi:hypothetical protein